MNLTEFAATATNAILAKKGAGKSNAAVTMAEDFHDAGIAFVAIDPKGDWWGIRSSADGTSAGLPVVVFGGKHGDVPLTVNSGALIADLILGAGGYLSCVLDVSQFTYTERDRFLLDFGERLFREKDEEGVLHLMLEEAHEYLPQGVTRTNARLVGMYQRIVKQGRFKGLGVTLISQRSAALNKDVLTQADNLIVLRTTSPQDRAAVKAWIDVHADSRAILDQLPSLPTGEAFLWAPEIFPDPQHITFRRRRTFDSGQTPKVGERKITPRTLADVDLDAISKSMVAVIEEQKSNDPKELRKQIRELQAEIDKMATEALPVERVEVSVLTDNDREVITAAIKMADRGVEVFEQMAITLREATRGAEPQTPISSPARAVRVGEREPALRGERPKQPRSAPPTSEMPRRGPRPVAAGDGPTLGKAERSILTVLAQHGQRSVNQVAVIAGYSGNGGGFRNSLSSLRTKGFIEGRSDLEITDEGAQALGDYDLLPTGSALAQWWKDNKLDKAQRAILEVLEEAYPTPIAVEEIAERTGYASNGGGFRNALSRLRSLELAEGRGEMLLNEGLAG